MIEEAGFYLMGIGIIMLNIVLIKKNFRFKCSKCPMRRYEFNKV